MHMCCLYGKKKNTHNQTKRFINGVGMPAKLSESGTHWSAAKRVVLDCRYSIPVNSGNEPTSKPSSITSLQKFELGTFWKRQETSNPQ